MHCLFSKCTICIVRAVVRHAQESHFEMSNCEQYVDKKYMEMFEIIISVRIF